MTKFKRNKIVMVGMILGTALIGSSSVYATIYSPFGTKLVGRQSEWIRADGLQSIRPTGR